MGIVRYSSRNAAFKQNGYSKPRPIHKMLLLGNYARTVVSLANLVFSLRIADYADRSELKILVTGGSGFLGSHLCERLLHLDHEVVCLDNFYTSSESNISHLIQNPNFELIRRDVIDPFHVEVDGIFNLACPASPVAYQKDPIKTVKTSFHGAINMLDLANRVGARILQASTSEVYGDPEVSPQSERYWGHVNPIGPRSCYDESKRLAETLFFDYYRQHQTEIRIARIFNTYGPRMTKDDGRVISNFIVQALKGEDITVYGDGEQTRSFCYVDDLISGLIKLFFSDSFHGPINLGNPEPISMFNLAKEIIDLTNSKSKISLTTLPEDDPKQRQPDIGKANDILNWFPAVPRTEGLLRTINSFKGV